MAVLELTYPTDEQLQLNVYNANIGGSLNRRAQFTVPAGVSWAVVGCVLADAATPASVESTLIPAIEALTEVTSVNGDQLYGQIPATVESASHEAVLHVSSRISMGIGTVGDHFTQVQQSHESLKPPLDKKWVVMVLRIPDPLDDTKITALEAAITGVTGVTTTEHLIDGTVSTRAAAAADLTIATHLRLDAIEV